MGWTQPHTECAYRWCHHTLYKQSVYDTDHKPWHSFTAHTIRFGEDCASCRLPYTRLWFPIMLLTVNLITVYTVLYMHTALTWYVWLPVLFWSNFSCFLTRAFLMHLMRPYTNLLTLIVLSAASCLVLEKFTVLTSLNITMKTKNWLNMFDFIRGWRWKRDLLRAALTMNS